MRVPYIQAYRAAAAFCLLSVVSAAASPLSPRQTARQTLNPADAPLREAIRRTLGIDASQKLNFVNVRADLNGDGHPEALVWVHDSYWGGTGGYPLLIFQHRARGFRKAGFIGLLWSPLYVLRSSSHGWRDLVMQQGGGEPAHFVRLRYDGHAYHIAKNVAVSRDEMARGQRLIGPD